MRTRKNGNSLSQDDLERRDYDRRWRERIELRLDQYGADIDRIENRINWLFGALAIIVVLANIALGSWVAVTITHVEKVVN